MWGIVILGGYEQFIKSHLRKIYIDGVSNMQEHLVVTLDGKDYLVEPGTNLLEFIKSQDTFVPSICYNESMDQFKHVIHVLLRLTVKLNVHVVR